MSPKRSRVEMVAGFAQYVSPAKVAFFREAGVDFVPGRREGPYLWDVDDRRLIDCHCNGGVFNLGHRHPAIVDTLRAALDELDIGNHHLVSGPRAALAELLARLIPGDLGVTVFGVSGGEAVDLAIKVARAHTGRTRVISARGGYHGHTGLALAAGDEKYRAQFGPPAPGFEQVAFDDADALAAALDSDTAAVLLETVPATLGLTVPSPGYLNRVRDLCDEVGALLVLDEVQAGLGRTGRLFGFEHFGVTPDILVLGKGLSGGVYPITATVLRRDLARVFDPDPFVHVSTFGGAEVGCRVAERVLEISSDPAFLAHVVSMGALLEAGVERLRAQYPDIVVGLRGLGLMRGIELIDPALGPAFAKAAFDAGLLLVYAYNDPRVVQLLPPLTIEEVVIEEILERLADALSILRSWLAARPTVRPPAASDG